MTAILDCSEISVQFGGLRALSGISFSVTAGEVLGIFGPNGAGKTTLFNAITGHVPLSQGTIRFRGAPITGLPPHRIFQIGLARTFQIPELVETQSVEANILLGAQFSRDHGLGGALRYREEAMDATERALAMFGLDAIRDKLTAVTSLFERKLIMMASALAAGPQLLLLDEPAGGLTDTEIKSLLRHTRKISELGRTILIIEHVMPVIMDLSTRVLVLDRGEIFAEGNPAEIRRDQRVRRLYFGEGV